MFNKAYPEHGTKEVRMKYEEGGWENPSMPGCYYAKYEIRHLLIRIT